MRTHLAVPVLVLLVSVGETAAAQSARLDYPQWRGRDRDGAASGFIEPSAWPAELSRRWTVPVGQGYATPIIVGHRVFMFTRRNGDELMTALNAETGSVLWRTAYAVPYDMFAATANHGPGPKATPLFVDGTLFTLGMGGVVRPSTRRTADSCGRPRGRPSSPSTAPLRHQPPTAASSSFTPATTTR